MPKLGEITAEKYGFLKLPGIKWFSEATSTQGLAEGGVYLLSGAEGSGKTNLALQIGVDLAVQGYKILYLALEQSPSELKHRIEYLILPARWELEDSDEERDRRETANTKITGLDPAVLKQLRKKLETEENRQQRQAIETQRVCENFFIDSSVSGMEGLPDFLARQVLRGPYYGVKLIVVDSIQALGTAPTSSKPYQRLYEFNRWAKEAGITTLLIGQVTKGGAIAGPRSLAHNVDCVLYLRKAMKLRPLFVPKNRFGPERHEPLALVVNKFGCLEKSKHAKAKASYVYGFSGEDFVEVQALVKLPKYGERPGIKAPYLPKQKLVQLVGIASSVHDIDISDLAFEINCALPGGRPYKTYLDLPLVVSMLSSYFQRSTPLGSLFLGEVDLLQKIRPLPMDACRKLAEILLNSEDYPLARQIGVIYGAAETCEHLESFLNDLGSTIACKTVNTLEELINVLWPDVV
ncbi:MAG: ATPase domain-containing protein [Thermofilaceae archaeon]